MRGGRGMHERRCPDAHAPHATSRASHQTSLPRCRHAIDNKLTGHITSGEFGAFMCASQANTRRYAQDIHHVAHGVLPPAHPCHRAT